MAGAWLSYSGAGPSSLTDPRTYCKHKQCIFISLYFIFMSCLYYNKQTKVLILFSLNLTSTVATFMAYFSLLTFFF